MASDRLPLVSVARGPLERARRLEEDASPEQVVIAYHERTKHHFHRFAASLGYMDWATQPDPFRRYAGADLVHLPLPNAGRPLPYWQLYAIGTVPPEPLSVESISLFFRYALSLTAWKRFHETTWSLRANPSSGDLHPTEGYAVLPAIEGLGDTAGVYHYAPREHALERRAVLDAKVGSELFALFPDGSFLVGLSSVHWREAWKYGERAFRYCQHDVGHALATLRIAAAALGWRLVLFDGVGDDIVSQLLGLSRNEDFRDAEPEEPEFLALIAPELSPTVPRGLNDVTADGGGVRWQGRANTLSPEHVTEWPVIDEVARTTRRSGHVSITDDFSRFPTEDDLFGAPVRQGLLTAEKAILGRRSALAMDGSTAISQAAFFRMLARLIPTHDGRSMPWDAIPWRPRIHLVFFVHRVDGLPRGLYALPRDPDKLAALKEVMRREFRWQRVPTCPAGLPLYLLQEGDCRTLAARVSCGQDIAGDGAFSLGMIADYMDSLTTYGAAFYRNLFWEAGMVGQVLYLEAEEAGLRSTGIGCYFDDPVHEVFGIASRDWQCFYHFAVGGPVEDLRLTTLPAYGWERAMRAPVIRLSDSARQALREAAIDAGGDPLRIQISDRFECDLFFGSRAEGDLEVDGGGITILLDPSSAQRADGLSIDFVSGPDGSGFTIENPNEPPRVRQISATELKAMMARGLSFELVDVRTEEERAIAKIEGSRLLNEESHNYLLSLDRNTTIVFHCHHGIRSQSAAEYFLREKSFRNVYNLQGGIDAWSQLVDPSVPRY